MLPYLFLAFLLVPLLEIAVFIQVGGVIGLWPTLGLVVLTAVVGSVMIRAQGLRTLARARESIDRNELPLEEVFDGVCLLGAGALLLTPGFVTDGLGTILLVPAARALLRRWLARQLIARGEVHIHRHGHVGPDPWSPHGRDEEVIEGEFDEVDDEPDEPSRLGPPRGEG